MWIDFSFIVLIYLQNPLQPQHIFNVQKLCLMQLKLIPVQKAWNEYTTV